MNMWSKNRLPYGGARPKVPKADEFPELPGAARTSVDSEQRSSHSQNRSALSTSSSFSLADIADEISSPPKYDHEQDVVDNDDDDDSFHSDHNVEEFASADFVPGAWISSDNSWRSDFYDDDEKSSTASAMNKEEYSFENRCSESETRAGGKKKKTKFVKATDMEFKLKPRETTPLSSDSPVAHKNHKRREYVSNRHPQNDRKSKSSNSEDSGQSKRCLSNTTHSDRNRGSQSRTTVSSQPRNSKHPSHKTIPRGDDDHSQLKDDLDDGTMDETETITKEKKVVKKDDEGSETISRAKVLKEKSSKDYDDMMQEHRAFFGQNCLYESSVRKTILNDLLREVNTLEKDNSDLRRQFLLRLMRTKFMEMNGPVIGFLNNLVNNSKTHELENFDENILNEILDFLDEILARIPHCMSTMVSVHTTMSFMRKIPNIKNSSVSSKMKELELSLCDPTIIMNKLRIINDPTKDWSPDLAFIKEPLIPPLHDLLTYVLPKKYKNLIDRSYGDSKKYIEIWFRLMREDFCRPLKTAITTYMNKTKQERETCTRVDDGYIYKFKRVDQTKIENGQQIVQLNFTEFKRQSLKHIDWAFSKRLRSESLIVLSENNFKSSIYGVIHRSKKNDYDDRKKGHVWVRFLDSCRTQFPNELTGIEPTPFWEPYRCVLERLRYQAGNIESNGLLPMEKYIVRLTRNVDRPCYLPEGTTLTTRKHEVMIGQPDFLSILDLDESQRNAVELALTHELAIIQGPPGCGKSYIGAHLVDLLILNRHLWQRHDTGCILLMAYTNHAIDQFVNECDAMGMDMDKTIRIGGRGNESMNRFLLKNRWKEIREMHEYGALFYRGNNTRRQLKEVDETVFRALKSANAKLHEIQFELYEPFMTESARHALMNEYQNLDHKDILEWMEVSATENFTNVEPLTYNEASRMKNVLTAPVAKRRQLYAYWCKCVKEDADRYLQSTREWREGIMGEVNEVRKKEDAAVLQQANIIAMTTTGASKHFHFLESIKPAIVLVEEAAEVLESHIVAPLTKGCKHLILIGDHEQLRPTIAEHKLTVEQRNLEISLFERMILNQMPNECLREQHRMHPDIANLLVPHIYRELSHHSSVSSYPSVLGMKKRMTLLHHTHKEHKTGENASCMNQFEAELLVALCKYLLQQGYGPRDLTILTAYAGQARLIRSLVGKGDHVPLEEVGNFDTGDDDAENEPAEEDKSKENGKGDKNRSDENLLDAYFGPFDERTLSNVKITTIDNFQGEENKIILFSFVRSNAKEQIGFLDSTNRVCVALSRAKHGFYAVGNFLMYSRKSEIWEKLCDQLYEEDDPKLSPLLEIVCQRHKSVREVMDAESLIKQAPEGGCVEDCDYRLNCGHMCRRKCHHDDPEHYYYMCYHKCTGTLECGHDCEKLCSEDGDDRSFSKMEYNVKHDVKVQMKVCSMCHKAVDCGYRVDVHPPCGHVGTTLCSQEIGYECQEIVSKILPCTHTAQVPCFKEPSSVRCKQKVNHTFSKCGHETERECHNKDIKCYQKIPYTFKDCKHTIKVHCHLKDARFKCDAEVEVQASCGKHTVLTSCCKRSEIIKEPCQEKVMEFLDCDHYITKKCHEKLPDSCHITVSTERKCGHYLKCPCWVKGKLLAQACSEMIRKYRPCGHFINIKCSDSDGKLLRGKCNYKCTLICSHGKQCRGHKCREACPPCKDSCQIHCIHSLCRRKCYEECDRAPCNKDCTRKLRCGHACTGLCGEDCPEYCATCLGKTGYDSKRIKVKPCNHDVPLNDMDQHMAEDSNDLFQVITPKYCLVNNCQKLITYCPRYGNYIKRYLRLLKLRDYQTSDHRVRWLYCKRCKNISKFDANSDLPEDHDCKEKYTATVDEVEDDMEEDDEEEEAPEQQEDNNAADDDLDQDKWVVRPPQELRNNVFFKVLRSNLFKADRPRPDRAEREDRNNRNGRMFENRRRNQRNE